MQLMQSTRYNPARKLEPAQSFQPTRPFTALSPHSSPFGTTVTFGYRQGYHFVLILMNIVLKTFSSVYF